MASLAMSALQLISRPDKRAGVAVEACKPRAIRSNAVPIAVHQALRQALTSFAPRAIFWMNSGPRDGPQIYLAA